jgi:hypothetical protein
VRECEHEAEARVYVAPRTDSRCKNETRSTESVSISERRRVCRAGKVRCLRTASSL